MAAPLSPIPTSTVRHGEPPTSTAPAQLINLREVCRRTGLGRSTVYNLINAGRFPRALKDPDIRVTRWAAAAVEAWIADRIARGGGGQ